MEGEELLICFLAEDVGAEATREGGRRGGKHTDPFRDLEVRANVCVFISRGCVHTARGNLAGWDGVLPGWEAMRRHV